jgi:group I intron endonuclease
MRKPYGYIYKITNLVNNKIYIGKKQSPVEVKNYYGSGKFLTIAFKKYGKDKFIREILCWKYSLNTLDKAEIFYIDYYDSTDPDIGYNVLPGGEGNPKGIKLSKKHKQKIGLSHKGKSRSEETKRKISSTMKGIKRSEETKRKMKSASRNMSKETRLKIGLANTGKVRTEETKLKMKESAKRRPKPTEEAKLNISKAKRGVPWSQANRDAFNKRFGKNTKNIER